MVKSKIFHVVRFKLQSVSQKSGKHIPHIDLYFFCCFLMTVLRLLDLNYGVYILCSCWVSRSKWHPVIPYASNPCSLVVSGTISSSSAFISKIRGCGALTRDPPFWFLDWDCCCPCDRLSSWFCIRLRASDLRLEDVLLPQNLLRCPLRLQEKQVTGSLGHLSRWWFWDPQLKQRRSPSGSRGGR